MYLVRVLLAVAVAALGFAAPAAADEDEFVRTLQTRYVYLTEQQLRAEGYKVCNALRSGVTSADAALMVHADLGMSMSGASELVSTAAVQLGC